MPRITPVHWRVLDCIALKAGYKLARVESSHRIYEKADSLRPLVIPSYSEIRVQIIKSLIRTSQIGNAKYFKFLAECK